MAITDLYKMLAYDTSSQMMQHDMLMNAYFHGSTVGANLRAMILGRQPVQPLTNPYDEAITGKMRSDSRAIRQNARNVTEAATMMGVARQAVSTIKSTLEEMEALAKKIKEERDKYSGPGTYEASDADKNDYEAMRDRITSTIQSTKFNNIALLDSSKWGTDQINASGSVHIQSFLDGGFDITFRGLEEKTGSQFTWSDLTGEELEDDPDGQISILSGYIGDMTIIEDIYSRRQDGLEYQAAGLMSQADLLDEAVEARRHTPTLSLEEILLRLLFRNSGTVMNYLG